MASGSEPEMERRMEWRRLLRFQLRTLLIITVLVGCVLGLQLRTVRARRAARAAAQAAGWQFVTADDYRRRYGAGHSPGPGLDEPAVVPFIRRCLGDEPIHEIWFEPGGQDVDRQVAGLRALFPEARIEPVLYPPCHPGCFPAGSWVETPQGPQRIETIKAGDSLLSVGHNGGTTLVTVEAVSRTDNRLWRITTDRGEVVTTETQPMARSGGGLSPTSELAPGDALLLWRDGRIDSATVRTVTPLDRVEVVYNVVLGDDTLFVVDGFVARSKPRSP